MIDFNAPTTAGLDAQGRILARDLRVGMRLSLREYVINSVWSVEGIVYCTTGHGDYVHSFLADQRVFLAR